MPKKPALLDAPLPKLEALSHEFGSGTWQKGLRYAHEGAVLRADIMRDPSSPVLEFVLDGEVQGSGVIAYEQQVLLWEEDVGSWVVDGECSCPVGHNCKHVVALLSKVLNQRWGTSQPQAASAGVAKAQPADQPYAQWDRWLDQTEDLHQATERTPPPYATAGRGFYIDGDDTQFQHFIVMDDTSAPGKTGLWLTLWPGKARRLKNKPGELGKIVQPKLYAGSNLGPHDGEGPVFDFLRRWYAGQNPGAVWRMNERALALPQNTVRDEVGALLLERAARAGELITITPERAVDRRLQWGPEWTLSWGWLPHPEPEAPTMSLTKGKAGSAAKKRGKAKPVDTLWQLVPRLPSATARLYMGEPMLYVDLEAGVCGRVDGQGIGMHAAQRWLGTPPMPESWMRAHAMRLTRLLPPLPSSVRGHVLRDIRGVTPQPVLTIRAHPKPERAVFLLQLAFDYDGVRGVWEAQAEALQEVDTPAGKVHVWRDVVAELHACGQLLDDGYMPLDERKMATWQSILGRNPGPHERDLTLLDSDFAVWRQAGFQIDMDEALRARLMRTGEVDLALFASDKQGRVQPPSGDDLGHDWFSLALGFVVDGQRVNLLPWLPDLIGRWADWDARAQQGQSWPAHTWLTQADGQAWRVPTEPLRPWLGALMELTQERGKALKGDTLTLGRFEAMRLATVDTPQSQLVASVSAQDANALAGLVAALRQPDEQPQVTPPAGLGAQLRPYQVQGLSWLQQLRQHRLGGILADDMGLGKTLQTIAHLLLEKQGSRLTHPALIVAPTSLVGNWYNELQRFAPGLSALILHGQQRHAEFTRIPEHDVVITTYPLLMRDEAVLTKQVWSVLVLDEAQNIKNAKTRAAGIVQDLQATQRLCLSGTPMENHLGEVWSLFHFVMPGYLGTEARFKQLFRTPIEKHGDADRLALLRARLAPFMLRRTKGAVASELPPKIETIEHIELPPAQANLYEVIRAATEARVRDALRLKGLAGSHITVLDALLKLRQVCCDPRLVPLDAARKVKGSAKIDWLVDNLPAMIDEGRRVLLFSQFTSMLTLIEEALAPTGMSWAKLTGQSKNRDAIVARFTSGEVPLFLISLKAGGVGLNLPQADTVVHVDPWWNPAAEDQATDRAHRMGQQSTVFVYKLVAQGTVEERIVAMQERKAALAQGLHGDDAQADAMRLTEGELDWLLEPIGAAKTLAPPRLR